MPLPASWINSEAYQNEVVRKKEYIKRDKLCAKCNQPATNAGKLGMWFCADCWDGYTPESTDFLREKFIRLEIKKDSGWKDPCLAYMKRLGGFGGLVGDG